MGVAGGRFRAISDAWITVEDDKRRKMQHPDFAARTGDPEK